MPFGFASWGVRCRACGKFINGMVQAFATMPDPFRVTCPYCATTAFYEKSAIEPEWKQKSAGASPTLLIVAVIAIAALIAAITYTGR